MDSYHKLNRPSSTLILVGAFALSPITCVILFGFPGQLPDLHRGLILTVLLYPVLEELTFRGFIQTSILTFTKKHFFPGLTIANILTSILFSCAHLFNYGIEKACLVFIPSLILGLCRELYTGLYAPIALHSFYNFVYIYLRAA